MERVDLQKSVPNVPTHEEFFGLDDNVLDEEDFEANDEKDKKIKEMIIIMLALLQEFYIFHMYDDEYYFASEQFEEDIKRFNADLKSNLEVLFHDYLEDLADEYDLKWELPAGIVSLHFELDELIGSGIDSVTATLYADLKDKADFYKEVESGKFSPHSNFRRALKKLSNQVKIKGHYLNKKTDRLYKELVYGQEALFYWICSGINTCAWCYDIEAMSPLPLSMLPIDHINGGCRQEPVFPDEYSEEYLKYRG